MPEAIAEAVTKQNMRFVQIKTQEQLDWQAMHRVRDRLMQRRTALINEIRGFLLERGLTFAARPIYLRKNLPTVIEDAEQNLSPRLRWLLDRLWQEWKQTELDIKAITDEIERISNDDARCRRLRQIPGFGPLVSTATVAAIGNGAAFRRGRDFAAWVGVVPRQYSTGGIRVLRAEVYKPILTYCTDSRCFQPGDSTNSSNPNNADLFARLFYRRSAEHLRQQHEPDPECLSLYRWNGQRRTDSRCPNRRYRQSYVEGGLHSAAKYWRRRGYVGGFGEPANFFAAAPDFTTYNQHMIRVDYNTSDKTKWYSFFGMQRGHEDRNQNGLQGIARRRRLL